jgi:hypothetical protein
VDQHQLVVALVAGEIAHACSAFGLDHPEHVTLESHRGVEIRDAQAMCPSE